MTKREPFKKKPLPSLVLFGLLLALLAGMWSAGTVRAGDDLDREDAGVIFDTFWDQRLFDGTEAAAIEIFHNPAGIPVVQAAFETELDQAFNNWEAVDDGLAEEPAVPIVNLAGATAVTDAAALDGVNAVVWTSGAAGGTLAITPCWALTADTITVDDGSGGTVLPTAGGPIPFPGGIGVTYPKGALIDCGMEFDSADAWSTSAGPSVGEFDVQSVASHEGGHFVALSHSTVGNTTGVDATSATMANLAITNDINVRSLEEDDKASLLRTYARTANPQHAATLGDRGIIHLDLKKGGACEDATGVSVWAYRTPEGLTGTNRVEVFSGSQLRAGLPGEPADGSVDLNVPPLPGGESYTIFARTLDSSPPAAPTVYSAFRYNNTTINSNLLDLPGQSTTFDNLATVNSLAAGATVDLGSIGIRDCWIALPGSNVDISADSVTAPGSANLGSQIAVTSSFSNLGTAASAGFDVGIYFSTDMVINADDVPTGSTCTSAGLAASPGPGDSGSCDGFVNVPELLPGTYYVGLLVDLDNDIGESDESNNGAAAVATINISADPLNPIINGSFETGDFSGWTLTEIDPASTPSLPLSVAGAGVEFPADTFSAPPETLDYFTSAPTHGQYAALHDFNGDDPVTPGSPNLRELYQDVSLPSEATHLLFDYRAAWELFRFGSTVDRTFSVVIEPSGGGAPLQSEVILSATNGGFEEDTDNPSGGGPGYPAGVVDLTALAGQAVRIKFVWDTPEPGTGFGFFQLDNVRILATPSTLVWENLVVSGVSNDAWTTVSPLTNVYTSPVVVCSANYESSDPPLVPRIQNASGSSFDVRVDRADGSTSPIISGIDVHCAVAEEGIYTDVQHGITMEAVTFTSTVTDHDASWLGQSRSYANTYTNPVVVGQVMTYNDAEFSAFWSRGNDPLSPPSASVLYVGKHVGEDPNLVRADDTIGYIVIESGSGNIGTVAYEAGLGTGTVLGVGDAPPYNYGLTGFATVTAAVVSQAAMDGVNGGWAVLYGPTAVTASGLNLAIDEDQVGDVERLHTNEQVAYLAFGTGPDPVVTITSPADGANFNEGDNIFFTGTATDPQDGDVTASLDWTSNLDMGSIGTGGSFSTSTLSVGTHVIKATATDSNSNTGFDSISITIDPNVAPTVVISSPADGAVVIAGANVTFTGSATDPEDGVISSSLSWTSNLEGTLPGGATFMAPLTMPGLHTITADVVDLGGLPGSDMVNVTVLASPPVLVWENLVVSGVSNDAWTTAGPLTNTYTSPVVVCSANYESSDPPLVPRIQNASGSSFDVRVDRADTTPTDPLASGVDVHCVVVEEGIYTQGVQGIDMEAVTFTSTVTDHDGSWAGENRGYVNTYTNPAVVGQVMTYNDAEFSAFWSRGNDRLSPPSASVLYVGKHVGEDPNLVRADETIGYIVIESGSGTISGVAYQAALGSDTVLGVGDAPPYNYGLSGFATVTAAVVSQAAMDGFHGGWAVLYGPTAVTASGLNLAIDEDQVGDVERVHMNEQVAYLAFGTSAIHPVVTITSPADGANFNEGDNISFTGTATDPQDGDVTASLDWTSNLDMGSIGTGGSFSTSTLSVGTHVITATATDSDSNTGFDSISITIDPNVAPTVVISSPADGAVVIAGANVTFTGSATDPEDGVISSSLSWTSDLEGSLATGVANFMAPLTIPGLHTITADVVDLGGLPGSDMVNVTVFASPPVLVWENLVVSGVSNDAWTTVSPLTNVYTSPVVVYSANYESSDPPLVPRIQNASGSSFDVRVGRADTTPTDPLASGVDVHCVVVEEGIYTQGVQGIDMEAVTFTSTVTDHDGSWAGENRGYVNTYTNPAVVGQVMTYNDAEFSAFWSRGNDRLSPPSASVLYVGKHVGEDPNLVRADETIGYIVIESGSGNIGTVAYEAGLGTGTVLGVGDAPPYNYGLSGFATVTAAVVSQAAMDGLHGGWAVLYGPTAVTASGLNLAIDEDQVGDVERMHINEQVAYLAFGTSAIHPVVTITSPADGANFNEGDNISFTGTATDPQDGDVTASLDWTSDLEIGSIGTEGSFSTSTLSVGTHVIKATATDSDFNTGFDSISITIDDPNVAPTVVISSPADGAVVIAGANVTFTGSATDPEDGVISSSLSWTSDLEGSLATGVANFMAPLTIPGLHTITADVVDLGGLPGSDMVNVTVLASPPVLVWENLVVSGVSNDAWTTVSPLTNVYTSPVVVCSANYESSDPPLVPRIQNASGSSFDVRVDRADGSMSPIISGIDVHCAVAEEGIYTDVQHGITMEAVTFTSTVTDHDASWLGQSRSYVNTYTNPAVVGQVMTYNDAEFSAFWSRGNDPLSPPSASVLYVGKHVGEDPNLVRADETIGYIVIESGSGTISGVAYQAALGSDTVLGVGDAPPYNYGLSGFATVTAAVVSQAAMDGVHGGWAVLYGPTAVTASGLNLAIDEDQVGDVERMHTNEQVAYLAFGTAAAPVLDPFLERVVVTNVDNNAWTTVNLAHVYTSMVAVCTPNYDATAPPLVARLQDAAGGNSFDVRVNRADGLTALITGVDVHCAVVEAGVYNVADHGVKMEAVRWRR